MDSFIQMIPYSGRSWWQARYSDGKILSEWDTLSGEQLYPLSKGKSSRWEEVPKKGMVGLRLLCPNGMAAELEAPEGYRFFQLKVGYLKIGKGQSTGKHIIGVVINSNGDCFCRAWDYQLKQLIQFSDNIYNMQYENLGKLNLEVQGLKV